MAKYLSINGTGDQLFSASVTWTKVVMDATVKYTSTLPTSEKAVIVGSTSTPYPRINAVANNTSTDTARTNSVNAYINGVGLSYGGSIPLSTRQTFEMDLSASGYSTLTTSIGFFTDGNNNYCIPADIYDIKIYNGSTLVAHYDMSTGTVNDQSGNGNNATLTGGTWNDNGVSPKAIVFDNFNRADNTTSMGNALTGQAWKVFWGQEGGTGSVLGGIKSNQAKTQSSTLQYGAQSVFVTDIGQSDNINLSVNVATFDGYYGGIAFRVVPNGTAGYFNGYYARFQKTNNKVDIWKKTGTTNTVIATATGLTITNGDIITIKLSGNTITLLQNGTSILTCSDSTYMGTMHGLHDYSSGTTVYYDNFLITDSSNIVYDSFDRADSTTSLGKSDTGQTWTVSNSTYGITSGTATNPGTGGDNQWAGINVGVSDARVSAVITGKIDYNELVGRLDNTYTTKLVGFVLQPNGVTAGSSRYQLYLRNSSGGGTVLATSTVVANVGDYIEMEFVGSTINCYVNSVKVITATNTTLQTSTWFGINGQSTSTEGFDNFTVTNLSSPNISVSSSASSHSVSTANVTVTGNTSVSVSGTSESTSSYQANTTVSRPVSSKITSHSNSTANTGSVTSVSGKASSTSESTANTSVNHPLHSTSASMSKSTANVSVSRPISSKSVSNSKETNTISVARPLSGTSKSISSDKANVAVSTHISSTTTSHSIMSNASVGGGTFVSGKVASSSSVKANVSVSRPISSSTHSTSVESTNLSVTRPISGSVKSASSYKANVGVAKHVSAKVESTSNVYLSDVGGGTFVTSKTTSSSRSTANVSVSRPISASTKSASSETSSVAVSRPISGKASSNSKTTANVWVRKDISAKVVSSSSESGGITSVIHVGGKSTGLSHDTGNVAISTHIESKATGTSTSNTVVSVTKPISSLSLSSSNSINKITVVVPNTIHESIEVTLHLSSSEQVTVPLTTSVNTTLVLRGD